MEIQACNLYQEQLGWVEMDRELILTDLWRKWLTHSTRMIKWCQGMDNLSILSFLATCNALSMMTRDKYTSLDALNARKKCRMTEMGITDVRIAINSTLNKISEWPTQLLASSRTLAMQSLFSSLASKETKLLEPKLQILRILERFRWLLQINCVKSWIMQTTTMLQWFYAPR